jgi:hypothetical protein
VLLPDADDVERLPHCVHDELVTQKCARQDDDARAS